MRHTATFLVRPAESAPDVNILMPLQVTNEPFTVALAEVAGRLVSPHQAANHLNLRSDVIVANGRRRGSLPYRANVAVACSKSLHCTDFPHVHAPLPSL